MYADEPSQDVRMNQVMQNAVKVIILEFSIYVIHMCMYLCINAYIYVSMYKCLYMYTHVYTLYMCMYLCLKAYIFQVMQNAVIYIYIYTYIYIYIYIYIHMRMNQVMQNAVSQFTRIADMHYTCACIYV